MFTYSGVKIQSEHFVLLCERVFGHGPKGGCVGIKQGGLRMDSSLIIAQSRKSSLVYRKEGESRGAEEETTLKQGDAYST